MRTFLRSALILFSILLLPFSAMAAERTILTTPDSDYFGHDLRTVQNVSVEQCQQECIGDQACKAFTYNVKAKWCFLKSDFDRINAFPGAIAGKIVTKTVEADIGAAPALSFLYPYQITDAQQYKSTLVPPQGLESETGDNLAAMARSAVTAGTLDTALAYYRGALAKMPDDADLWVETANAANRVAGNYDINMQGQKAAINAYFASRGTNVRAQALASLALALDRNGNYRQGIDAYKASLALVDDVAVASALDELRVRQGFRMTGNTVDSDAAIPRACAQFSEALVKNGVDYTDFVTVDGQQPKAVDASGSQICVEGLVHGQHYTISLREGLPSIYPDEPLKAQVDLQIYVRDRSPMVRFTGDSFVLPSTGRHGIPLVSINSDGANLNLYRVGDRSIAALMTNSQFLTQLDGYTAQRIQDEIGQQVWTGKIDLSTDLNKEVITSFPVDEALPERKPGVYVLTAAPSEGVVNEWDAKATQWFVVSDIGLSTFAGTDGLTVFVRSLATAKPIANATVQLLAKNNEILGTATSDAEGKVKLSAGLLRGSAAMVPAVLTATAGNDFVFLDMTRAGFDLSDRGVTGRPAPGAVDVLAWTERGIYRAGETVHLAALSRDIAGKAIEKLPLTFVFLRPDGVEDRRLVSEGGIMGGHALDLPLQETAMRGTWTVQIYTDPKQSSIAEKTFLVDDFVPDRIEFDMASADKQLRTGMDTMVNIDGRYLYGAPAAGLSLEGEIVIAPTHTRDDYKGYLFGLADEEAQDPTRITLDSLNVLDDQGKTSFPVNLTDLPSTTQLLNAKIVVRMKEAGGRAVERDITLPIANDDAMIGIKPEFSGDLGENSIGNFHVIGVDADGKTKAMTGLSWKLLQVERDYQWYRDGYSWRYEPITRVRALETGKLDLTADGGKISVPVKWGRYRLEIETAQADGPTSSVEFDAGWYVPPTSTETPDGLEMAFDKDSYKIGDVAKVKITSRYAGDVLVNVGSESLIVTKNQTLADTGGVVEIPVTEDFGSGSYVTATLFRPGNDQESRMPMRAIGVKWLAVDPGERKLSIDLATADQMLPRQPMTIDVSVKGAGVGEQANVIVAAVDVGILNLTKYQAPDPDGWYFGQRMLGLEIRDLYGRLIDGSLGTTGKLRTGGDGSEDALEGSPPTEKLVAFFSGPVTLDANGKATISFDIPQFNGTARLMAVAWSKDGVGHATKDVIIRDPVVVTASLPNFLAPEDKTQLLVDIANTDAPAGTYTLALSTTPELAIDGQATQTVTLEQGGKQSLTIPVKAVLPGKGQLTLTLTDGKGLELSQVRDVPVRSPNLPVTERRLVKLEPGRSLTLNDQLLADSVMQGASVSVNVTRSPAFDVAALAMKLDRYPYGCAEQTTSRALPLLYLNEVAAANGLPEDSELKKRIQDAVYRVLSYQSSSGSFGLWGPGSGDLWLDAYVTDFLTRARELKYDVPQVALETAVANLQNGLGYDNNVSTRGNEMAYALYVLARNRKASISDMRYYADTMINDFPTPLARAHVAAALALYGDVNRSQQIFENALGMSSSLVNVSLDRSDYGSQLRDDAAVLALAAESNPKPSIIPQLSKMVAREWETARWTSTQEDAWLMLAARALKGADEGIKVSVNNQDQASGLRQTMTGEQLLANPLVITNKSPDQVTAVVTSVAAPQESLAAGGDGFEITRTYYTMEGEETNPSEAVQNQRYVVVLNVKQSAQWPTRIMVADLLPAGFQIDNPSVVNSASLSNFDWLPETTVAHVEFRTDRFIAALDRYSGDPTDITLAYVVRAVSPGTYVHPAATVEDMYRPQFSARTATGMMAVGAPGESQE